MKQKKIIFWILVGIVVYAAGYVTFAAYRNSKNQPIQNGTVPGIPR